jgi:L-fuconolactonase
MATMRVLDSHLHLWDPAVLDYDWLDGRLRDRFGPEALAAERAAASDAEIRGAVFVEADAAPAQSLAEVDWVAGLRVAAGIRGIVARAALERGDRVQDELDALADRPLVVGVRRLIQSEPAGFATSRAYLAGTERVSRAGLTFDAGIHWPQLPEVIAIADASPDLEIVLDHLGKPPIGSPTAPADPSESSWLPDIRALAKRPRTWCKLSGLPAESALGWTPEQVVPFLDAALDAFGPDRLIFGSDWPVSAPYGQWLATVAEWAEDRVGDRADAILCTNAERVYRLA